MNETGTRAQVAPVGLAGWCRGGVGLAVVHGRLAARARGAASWTDPGLLA